MLEVLKGRGHYPLGPLATYLLHDVIEKPARSAGLTIYRSLAHRIIEETGNDPGKLPLLAFVLERLFAAREGTLLSERAYDAFKGVQGAIEEHVRTVEWTVAEAMGEKALEQLPNLFQSLVVVNAEGQATRRRAVKGKLSPDLQAIADHLVTNRLLITEGEAEESTLSVAHEKLFDAWPALARWVAENRDDLLMLHQAELEALEWQNHGYALTYLPRADRLKRLQGIIRRLGGCDTSPLVSQYADPRDILLPYLKDEALSHRDRLLIGQYLAELGDPRPGVGLTADGLPDIDWVDIPGGTVTLEEAEGTFEVAPFRIARYPVTNSQFGVFLDAPDGYRSRDWWKDMEQRDSPYPAVGDANFPRSAVTWHEAVAFGRWLTWKYREMGILEPGKAIRLPTEWEWQQAATRGNPANLYPSGPKWDASRCNSIEGGLARTIAVGLYPHGTWPGGPLDLLGNVSEWCLNKYDPPEADGPRVDTSGKDRAIRGSSWINRPKNVHSTGRNKLTLGWRNTALGFRLAQDV